MFLHLYYSNLMKSELKALPVYRGGALEKLGYVTNVTQLVREQCRPRAFSHLGADRLLSPSAPWPFSFHICCRWARVRPHLPVSQVQALKETTVVGQPLPLG